MRTVIMEQMKIGRLSVTSAVYQPFLTKEIKMLIAKAEASTSSFTPVPAGMHLARCYRIVDTGTQRTEWQGKEKWSRKIMIQFEVHSEDEAGKPLLTPKGEPLSISKNYTLSLAEMARLSIDLESWRGSAFTPDERKGFNLEKLLGVWAMITVSKSVGRDGNEYTNIANINPVPPNIKKLGLPEPVNENKVFSIDNPDMALFETFSDKMKQKIEGSPEWQARGGKSSPATDFDALEDF
jgi:hypothetical protein